MVLIITLVGGVRIIRDHGWRIIEVISAVINLVTHLVLQHAVVECLCVHR